jgi:hypothetical protein
VETDYFFDNREYKKSSFAPSQTQQGIWLNVLGGVAWDEKHTICAGANLLRMPGMSEAISKADFTLYYQYRQPKVLFRAGAFARKEALPNYTDFFFEDSVNHFMPLMQGLFWQAGKGDNFFNAWMDWTGYATENTRENFSLGLSGKISEGIFFGEFQSYLFHYAGTFPGNPAYGVSEHLQAAASAGLRCETANGFRGEFAAGILAGTERDRTTDESHHPTGFTARLNAELRGIGTENTLYAGDARMNLLPRHGGSLYRGTPFLRAPVYFRSKWYVRLLESAHVSAKINCNLHFTEGHVLFQQTLSVTANIDNLFSREAKRKSADSPLEGFFR